MNNFEFLSSTRILFGKGTQHEVGAQVKRYANKILLHYGGGSIKRSGLYDEITASLQAAGVEYVELGGVQPNPRLPLVQEGIALCRREDISFVLAVGGGSVIDSAKAIAIGVPYEGDVWDFYAGKAEAAAALQVATVLTIPAAGSESSPSSVITNDETAIKNGYTNEIMRPVFSILNPEFCFTLPQNQMANGVCDMMTHIFERYFTNTAHVDLTDRLCEATLRSIMQNAPKLLANMHDYDAWAEIMWAGSIAHNGLLGMGRDEDWASHGIEHELSAIYDIAHGAGLAIVNPAWMKYVYHENRDMFLQFAVNVMGVSGSLREPEDMILEGIAKLEAFYQSLGLAVRLCDIGIDDSRFAEMAQKATRKPLGSFRPLQAYDVEQIYRLAL